MPTQMRANRDDRRDTSASPKAFSLAELLVVVAIVATLALLQLPTLGNAKSGTKLAICQDNLHQLTRGWLLYAGDHDGWLPGNLNGGDAMLGLAAAKRSWCVGWLDFAKSSANTNTLFFSEAQLGPYVRKVTSIYRCPADPSLADHGDQWYPRVRSVSMNGYLGDGPAPWTTGYRQFKKLQEVVNPSPNRAFVFIDERDDSINDPYFAIAMDGSFPPDPRSYTIVDFPADWHNRGANLSFVDGHVETWHWRDPRTLPLHRRGVPLALNVRSPNNPDVARLQAAASSRAK